MEELCGSEVYWIAGKRGNITISEPQVYWLQSSKLLKPLLSFYYQSSQSIRKCIIVQNCLHLSIQILTSSLTIYRLPPTPSTKHKTIPSNVFSVAEVPVEKVALLNGKNGEALALQVKSLQTYRFNSFNVAANKSVICLQGG